MIRAVQHPDWRAPWVIAALTALALAMVAAVVSAPVIWLLLSLTAVSLTLGGGGRAWIESLPAAAVLLLATTMLLPLVTGVAGIRIIDGAPGSRAVLIFGLAAAMGAAWRISSQQDRGAATPWRVLAPAAAPALLMAGLLLVLISAGPSRLSWFLSGDHLRHLGLTTRTLEAGTLEYGMLSYPHGWHALMASMWQSTGSARDGRGLSTLVSLQAASTWISLTLIPLALSLIAAALAQARGLRPGMAGVSGLVTGSLVLGPMFFGDYVPRGFETTLLALLVLGAALYAAVVASDSDMALAVALAAGFVIAHSWQVLLVPVCLLSGFVLWRRRVLSKRGGALAGDVLLVGACVLASLPGVLAALADFGLGAAAEAGEIPPPVTGWFIAGALSLGVVSLRGDRWPVSIVALVVGATFLTSVTLMWLAGVPLSSYYPNKTLWVAAVLGLPGVGALVSVCLLGLDGDSFGRRAGFVALGTCTGLLIAWSAAAPVVGVLRGRWGGADAVSVLGMVTSPAAPKAQVIWRGSNEVDDATGQLLLDFYNATALTPRLGLAAATVEEQCALLVSVRRPVVISNAPAREVRSRFDCVPGVEIVTTEGTSG